MASKELIYKDDARRAILKANPSVAFCIDNIKAVDAKPVVRGRWIDTDYKPDIYCKCSECGRRVYAYDDGYNYCPNCGADMRGKEDG